LTGAGAINGITLSGTTASLTLATNAAATLTGPVQLTFSGFGTLETSISVGKTITLSSADNYTLTATASGNVYVSGGTDVTPADGGTGVSNNAASTITISGAYALTMTLTGTTGVTLPTTGTLATLAGTETLSGKTLTAPKFADLGFIADASGNELIIFDTVASAVNEITFANAATGNPPTFTASGGDTNIGIKFVPKGTGAVLLPNGLFGTPALAFTSDLDSGFYAESANDIRFSAGGAPVCKFSSDGTSTFFGPASSPIARTTATGEIYFAMQAYSGALWGVRIGDPATKAYIRAAAAQTASIMEWQNSIGTALASLDKGGNPSFPKTITAGGTTGAQTIDKASGSVNFAAGASSLVVTNSIVTTSSVIQCTVATNDATATFAKAVAAAGSFTIYITAATAETRVNFNVTN